MENNNKFILGAIAGLIGGGLLVAFTTTKTGKENQELALKKVDEMKVKIMEFKDWLKSNFNEVTEAETTQIKDLISELEGKINNLTSK